MLTAVALQTTDKSITCINILTTNKNFITQSRIIYTFKQKIQCMTSSNQYLHPFSNTCSFKSRSSNTKLMALGGSVLIHSYHFVSLLATKIKIIRSGASLFETDLTGSQDGSVQLWEWSHQQPLSTPRPPGTYAKVTRVRFSQHGNKFGVADSDGILSLWQLGLTSAATRPFFVSNQFFLTRFS